MSRPWKAARRCSSCLYPNDFDANFCQACGTCSKPPSASQSQTLKTFDNAAIEGRFEQFLSVVHHRPYQRQKCALENQLSEFLGSLSPPKSISSCSVDDIIKFLISKDKSGRTIVHNPSCPGTHSCRCPRRLAAGTVDSLLGKLRAIFNGLGRLNDSNPVAHPKIKEYYKFVCSEQASCSVIPSQAVPLFFVKFQKLISFLRGLFPNSSSFSKINKYILVRDCTFFVVNFFTGDRGSDLGRLLAKNVFKFKDREGYLLRFTVAKTLRRGRSRSFPLTPFKERDVCPVAWLGYYISVCQLLQIPLAEGYFFRTTCHGRDIGDGPFIGSAINNRLKKYLLDAGLYNNETPHSFRIGLSNSLKLLGCSQEDIARYLGWSSTEMPKHYTRTTDADASLGVLENVFQQVPSLEQSLISSSENLDRCVKL